MCVCVCVCDSDDKAEYVADDDGSSQLSALVASMSTVCPTNPVLTGSYSWQIYLTLWSVICGQSGAFVAQPITL